MDDNTREGLQRIIHARDYHAEHGKYPPQYEIVCFDDWAADIADTVLETAGITDRLSVAP